MTLGMSVTATGIEENIARLGAIPEKVESFETRMLSVAAIETGEKLKVLLNMPKRTDPFWGVTGAASPFGLALRTGITRSAVIVSGQVYRDGANTLWTFVAHPSQHVADLEDGKVKSGEFWIPTGAAQTEGGEDRYPNNVVPGGFVWPTKKMKKFKSHYGPPKNKWIAVNVDGKLVLMKMHKTTVTLKPHHTFATAREQMQPRFQQLAEQMASEIVKVA